MKSSRDLNFNFQVVRCGNGGHIRLSRKWIGKNVRVTIEEDGQPLTEREKEYIKAHEDEMARDKMLNDLIRYWTGKTFTQQGEIIAKTPKGENCRKRLLEESKGHMVKLSKQMTTSDINWNLSVIRELSDVANAFGDILYDESELRENKDKMLGT
jgi:putative transposon-encoded protein